MWDPNSNILGKEENNRMECARITNGGRSLSKEGTWRNLCREETLRSANEKMERRTGVDRSPAYYNTNINTNTNTKKKKKKKKKNLLNTANSTAENIYRRSETTTIGDEQGVRCVILQCGTYLPAIRENALFHLLRYEYTRIILLRQIYR